jgi:hypothetical protein
MFTNEEYETIKYLATGELETNVAGDISTFQKEKLDLATLPMSNFDTEDEETLRRLQNCQAILRRIDNQVYRKAGLVGMDAEIDKAESKKEESKDTPDE